MLIDIAAIIAGFLLLAWGSDKFIEGAAALARNLGVSPMLIGLTIVGFGTSAPEVLVSGMASINGNAGLAIGNAVGSNIANIGLILGVTALVCPLSVSSVTLRREYPILLAVSLGAVALMLDGTLTQRDGVALVVGLVVVMGILVRIGLATQKRDPLTAEYRDELPPAMSNPRAAGWFLIGLLVMLGGSRLLVWGAVNVATAFGVSDLIIGLTIVAVGTSLPELAAGITSALKNEHDIALGNVIGSNIFNLLAVLPLAGLIAPGAVAPELLTRDLPVMIGFTIALLVMGYGFGGPGRVNRLEATILMLGYAGYQGVLIWESLGGA